MSHKILLFVYIFYICLLTNCKSAKILAVFPVPSISHQVVFRPLMHELARRGHEVVVVTTDPVYSKGQGPQNLTEIDVHDLSYELRRKTMLKLSTGKQTDLFAQTSAAFDLILEVFMKQMQTKEVKDVIFSEKSKFDLVFVEACVRPALALSHIIKAPLIQISSFGPPYGSYENLGAPSHPILYPSVTRQKLYNLTIWDKINELYIDFRLQNNYFKKENNENLALRSIFGLDMPDLNILSNNIDMLFLNINPILEGNHPVPSNIVHIYGIHKNIQKQLPKDLKETLDTAQKGVIYISFGTNVEPKMLPKEKIQDMIKVLSKLPYQILWKWNENELPGKSDNIKISKWFPQSDLLKHPNVKLFITQGGLQSTDEAITAGVPLIGMPLLGDQWYNVEKYVHHGIGIRLDIDKLTQETFQTSIETILRDNRYKTNIEKLRSLLEDQPQSSLDRAVWWTEYVIKHQGAKHLKSPAANISWSQYLELELVLFLIVMFITLIIILYFISKILLRYFITLFFDKKKKLL